MQTFQEKALEGLLEKDSKTSAFMNSLPKTGLDRTPLHLRLSNPPFLSFKAVQGLQVNLASFIMIHNQEASPLLRLKAKVASFFPTVLEGWRTHQKEM